MTRVVFCLTLIGAWVFQAPERLGNVRVLVRSAVGGVVTEGPIALVSGLVNGSAETITNIALRGPRIATDQARIIDFAEARVYQRDARARQYLVSSFDHERRELKQTRDMFGVFVVPRHAPPARLRTAASVAQPVEAV